MSSQSGLVVLDPRIRHPFDASVHSMGHLAYVCSAAHKAGMSFTITGVDSIWQPEAHTSGLLAIWGAQGTRTSYEALFSLLKDRAVGSRLLFFGPNAEYLSSGFRQSLGAIIVGDLEEYLSRDPSVGTATCMLKDLDTLPAPCFELMVAEPPAFFYDPISRRRRLVGTLWSSRGCPGRCSFCMTGNSTAGRWRGLSPSRVVAEAIELQDRYGVSHIQFLDDSFWGDTERARSILSGLNELDITSGFAFRPVDAASISPSLLASLGVRRVEVGLEHTHPSVLSRYAKTHQGPGALRAISNILSEGIDVRLDLIPFDPWTNLDELRALASDLMATSLLDRIASSPLHRLDVIPGTRIARRLASEHTPVNGYFKEPAISELYKDLAPLIPSAEEVLTLSRRLAEERNAQSVCHRALLSRLPHEIVFLKALGEDVAAQVSLLDQIRCSTFQEERGWEEK